MYDKTDNVIQNILLITRSSNFLVGESDISEEISAFN